VEITNRFLFTNLNELQCGWELQGDGETLDHGSLSLNLEPQKSTIIAVPFKKPVISEGIEYQLLVSFRLKEKTRWADRGFEISWDQFNLPWFIPLQKAIPSTSSLSVLDDKDQVTISGKAFKYVFDKAKSELVSINLKGKEMIKRGARLNVWHAPLANELDEWSFGYTNSREMIGYGRVAATGWYSEGLDKLKTINEMFTVRKTGDNVIVEIKNLTMLGNKSGAFISHYVYSIDGNGEMTIDHSVLPDGQMPSWLPRIGTDWILDSSLRNVEWYGRGPQENYPDRKTGYKTGIYKSTVKDMYEPYLIPQDYGLRTDNRWVRMTDNERYRSGIQW